MTAFQPYSGPENPEKSENLGVEEDGVRFSPLSPFSEPGAAQNAVSGVSAVALAVVRAYRRPAPPEPPRAPRRRRKPDASHPQSTHTRCSVPTSTMLPGVPPDWCKGVALLAALPPPPGIPLLRWTLLAVTSARLLRDHGAALHWAGWDALDLFGLHPTAPAINPPGWGVAWLLWVASALVVEIRC